MSALARRRELAALTKPELIDAVLYAEGVKCKSCDAEIGDSAACTADGSDHSWA